MKWAEEEVMVWRGVSLSDGEVSRLRCRRGRMWVRCSEERFVDLVLAVA